MGYSIPQTKIQSTQETGLPAGLDELIKQSGYSREQILAMVIRVQANQIQILQNQIDMMDMMPEPEPPREFGWGGLGLAGLVGYWLGGFSQDD